MQSNIKHLRDQTGEYVTPDEAQLMFDLSRTTLWRWREQESLSTRYAGGFVWYRTADIRNIIERNFDRPCLSLI
jgi:hypothetical protein